MTPRTPVDGPYPVHVEQIPAGVTLDVEALVRRVVADVVELLLGDRFDDFERIAECRPATDPERLMTEQLVAELVAETATRIPVYGAQVLALADRLRELAGPRAAGRGAAA